MNQQTTRNSKFEVSITAHRRKTLSLLHARITASAGIQEVRRTPLRVAIVIDRSSSMSGEKLAITKQAVARFIRTLEPTDQIAIVTYDDRVDILCGLTAPSEHLAMQVERIRSRGSTNLYDGWLTGAKIVGRGGRVILLSDGQANQGCYTDGESLSRQSALTYEGFGVTTSTIGVGSDYDESVMAGMAHKGGGAHYFAHTASAVMDAFNQERYSIDSVALESVTFKLGNVTEQVGHLWAGETKNLIFAIRDLARLTATIEFTDRATGLRESMSLEVPSQFADSPAAHLEYLLKKSADVEEEMLSVTDPGTAAIMKKKLRAVVLELLEHPSHGDLTVAQVIDRLKRSIGKLEQLEVHFEIMDAMVLRKSSMQGSHNIRERAKAFSSFDEDKEAARLMSNYSVTQSVQLSDIHLCPDAMLLAPLSDWLRWQAMPVELNEGQLVVAMEDPRQGFTVSEIEKVTGKQVKAIFAGKSSAEICESLQAL